MNYPLLDLDFLSELDSHLSKEIYARIIALDFQENPVEQIEGQVTGGSINIDGTSTIRRSCSLTLIVGQEQNQQIDINNFYWGIKNKFKLELGVRNEINKEYPDIIWFPQGIYVITNFSVSVGLNNKTISISGKDKMCLLNGDLGGSLPASIDFGAEQFFNSENGAVTITKIPIDKIIREALHAYALEPYHNIVINDLDDMAIELLEYRGHDPLYMLRDIGTGEFVNYTLNGNAKCRFFNQDNYFSIKDLENEENKGFYDQRISLSVESNAAEPSVLIFEGSTIKYTVAKIEYGQTAGYRRTDLVYPGDLISSIGESITSAVLDKIKSMLGNYEYFYDLNGRFIFQRKKTYISNPWNNLKKVDYDVYADSAAYSSSITYQFKGSKLISTISNQPQLNNLKNDFSVWGERTSVSGTKIPIHYRYAIDYKPTEYTTLSITENDIKDHNMNHPDAPLKTQDSKKYTSAEYDWREIIYRMAEDYYKYNQLDCYSSKLIAANKEAGLYQTGMTGYEAYYTDLQGFWRQLYNPIREMIYIKYVDETVDAARNDTFQTNKTLYLKGYFKLIPSEEKDSNTYILLEVDGKKELHNWFKYTDAVLQNATYYQYIDDGNYYPVSNDSVLSELLIVSENVYNKFLKYTILDGNGQIVESTKNDKQIIMDLIYYIQDCQYEENGWNKQITENPAQLNFWFDFLDSDNELAQFAIPKVGDRSKVVNETNITAIYFREVPNVLFTSADKKERDVALNDGGYVVVNMTGGLENCFSISAQGQSAQDKIDELLYNYSYCVESINMTTIPIYYLQPNTRIFVEDLDNQINGEYIVNKITIPLAYNGTMSINATKAPERIY